MVRTKKKCSKDVEQHRMNMIGSKPSHINIDCFFVTWFLFSKKKKRKKLIKKALSIFSIFVVKKMAVDSTLRPSELKNKQKREDLYRKERLEKQKKKSQKRKQLAKAEEKNPELKKVKKRRLVVD
jgi:hypothetical protein